MLESPVRANATAPADVLAMLLAARDGDDEMVSSGMDTIKDVVDFARSLEKDGVTPTQKSADMHIVAQLR